MHDINKIIKLKEIDQYKKIYADIKLNCNNINHKAYNYIPNNFRKNDVTMTKRYSHMHLFLLAISPMLILLLGFYAYIKIQK